MNAPPSLCEPTTTPDRGAVCAQIAARLAVCPVCCPRVLPARAAPPQSHSPRTTVEKPRGRGAHRMQRSSSGGRRRVRPFPRAARREPRRDANESERRPHRFRPVYYYRFRFRISLFGRLPHVKSQHFTSGCRSLPRISHVSRGVCRARTCTRALVCGAVWCRTLAVTRVYSALTVTRRHTAHTCAVVRAEPRDDGAARHPTRTR